MATNVQRVRRARRPARVTFLVEGPSGGRMLRLRYRLGMPRRVFARLFPVSERSLASIEGGKEPGEGFQRRHEELSRVVEALGEVVRSKSIGRWLQTPQPAFGGLKPIELIERGETDRIWEMVYRLRSGAVT